MKNNKKYIISLIITLLICINGFGQNPMSLYYMETIPQLNRMNPAMQPRTNGFFGWNIGVGIRSDLMPSDLIQKHGSSWFLPVEAEFDYKPIYDRIGKSYDITTDLQVDLLNFGFRSGRGYFTFSFSEKVEALIGVPSDFFKIMDVGLPNGSKLDLSSFHSKNIAYTQILLGYSYQFTDELTIGVNLRSLAGQAASLAKFKKFDWTVDRKLWYFDVDAELYTSGPFTVEEKGNKDMPEMDVAPWVKDLKDKSNKDVTKELLKRYGKPFSKNQGFAADIGAVYRLYDKWTFSAALNNLGFIKWKNDLNSVKVNGKYNFEGLIIDKPKTEDMNRKFFDNLGDSLKTKFDYPTGNESFNTSLSPSLYVGASYDLTYLISVGFLSRTVFYEHGVNQFFNLSANMLLYDFLSLNVSFNQNLKGGTYMGAGIALELGPLQIFAITDYLPLSFSNIALYKKEELDTELNFMPTNFRNITLIAGVNILLGKKGLKDKPMLERVYY